MKCEVSGNDIFDINLCHKLIQTAKQVGVSLLQTFYHDRCTAISSGNSHPASLYVPYRYDNGNDSVQEGVYRIVDEKGRIGYADEHGNTLIEPRFAFGFPFENGKAKVTDTGEQKEIPGSDGEYHYWESDDWYYIDRKGQRIE